MTQEHKNRGEWTTSKRLGVIAVAILAVVALFLIIPQMTDSNSSQKSGAPQPYELDVAAGEVLALSNLRLAIAQSAVDGTGKMTADTCTQLQKIAMSYDESADWFSTCESGTHLRGKLVDTATTEVVQISDDNYCATFETTSDGAELNGYKFTKEACEGYSFSIE